MCGISGLFLRKPTVDRALLRCLDGMNARLSHRGPDASGIWRSTGQEVALGHTRLAIIDLSPGGAQPKASQCDRYVLTFNGEIYNYLLLRKELEADGVQFQTDSDTEVLLELIAKRGFSKALEQLDGMFAFAVWDKKKRRLFLARDRAGEKPLYFAALNDGSFVFGSELKALIAYPRFDRTLDSDSLNLYMRHGYIPSPNTIFKCARKLSPGCWVEVAEYDTNPEVKERFYWDPVERNQFFRNQGFEGSYSNAVDELDRLLLNSVSLRMLSDVPLGSFLSGGVDSSLVTALMQELQSAPVRTFTIGFGEKEFDESAHARAVASHLGTQHTELEATPQDALNLVESLPEIYCEPLSDSSQLPTILVSQLARKHITVALSGDGGDELFAGYMQYPWLRKLWKTVAWIPAPIRKVVFGLLARMPRQAWRVPLALGRPFLSHRLHGAQGAHRMRRLMEVASSQSIGLAHRQLVSDCRRPERYLPGTKDPGDLFSDLSKHAPDATTVQLLSLLDFAQYLPADLLAKLDRASMSVALETRVPILDHAVAEFAWSLPDEFKLHQGRGKRILRDVLYRRVPAELIDRPKMGFRVPVSSWLKGPLKEWGADLISPQKLALSGVFDESEVARSWQLHQSGEANLEHRLWSVLIFQSWHRWLEQQPVVQP